MSFRTCLRVDCDLGTLPVNVRTSRPPSLSMIRQCRNSRSERSSFFSEKFILNIGLGWLSFILPPHCVRSPGSVYHSHRHSIRFPDACSRHQAASLFLQAHCRVLCIHLALASICRCLSTCLSDTTAQLPPLRAYPRKDLDYPAPAVRNSFGFLPWFSCGLSASTAIRFCGSLRHFPVGRTGIAHLLQIAGLLAARPGAPSAGVPLLSTSPFAEGVRQDSSVRQLDPVLKPRRLCFAPEASTR